MKTEIKRRYYHIGQVAKSLDVDTSTIRFWERYFPIKPKKSSVNGQRKYTVADYLKVCLVHQLIKIEQYTLKGAQRQIDIHGGFDGAIDHFSTLDLC